MRSAGWCAHMQAEYEKEQRAKRQNDLGIPTTYCPKCGSIMRLRHGKYGDFMGCSNYPNCKGTIKINYV